MAVQVVEIRQGAIFVNLGDLAVIIKLISELQSITDIDGLQATIGMKAFFGDTAVVVDVAGQAVRAS